MNIVYYNVGSSQLECLEMSIKSVNWHIPNAKIIIYSDNSTMPFDADIQKIKPDEYIAIGKMQIMSHFSDTDSFMSEPTIFLDADILCNNFITDAFDSDSDVTLTYRNNMGDVSAKWPYNGGLVYCNPTQKARDFIQSLKSYIPLLPEDEKKWAGDQTCLAYAVKDTSAKIATKSCDTHNYSAPYGIFPNPCSDVYFVHFKGDRKSHMLPYFKIKKLEVDTYKIKTWRHEYASRH